MLSTVIFYNFILLLSTLLVRLSIRAKPGYSERFFLFLAFLVVALPVGLRYNLGIDYSSYESIFNRSVYGFDSYVEPGYFFLNKLIYYFGGSADWLFLFVALSTYVFVFLSYPREGRVAFHYFAFMIFFFQSFNIMRNMLALAMVLYALMEYYKNNKMPRFFLVVFFSSFIHVSVLFYLIFPFLKGEIIRSLLKLVSYIFIFIVAFFVVFNTHIVSFVLESPLTRLLGFDSYADSKYMAEQSGSGLAILARFLFLAYFVLNIQLVLDKGKKFTVFIPVIIVCCLFTIISAKVVIFKRLEDVFSLAYIFAPMILLATPKILFRKTVVGLFAMYLFVVFNYTILTGSVSSCTGAMVAPYVSVFNKEDEQRISRSSVCQ